MLQKLYTVGIYQQHTAPVRENIDLPVNHSRMTYWVTELAKETSKLVHFMVPISTTREETQRKIISDDLHSQLGPVPTDIGEITKRIEKRKGIEDIEETVKTRIDVHGELAKSIFNHAFQGSTLLKESLEIQNINAIEDEVYQLTVVNDYSEWATKTIKSLTGDCQIKAIIAAAVFLAACANYLKEQDFTPHEIENANIRVTILKNISGDHVVCSVKLFNENLNKNAEFIMDPWMEGAVIDGDRVSEFYTRNGDSHYCNGETVAFQQSLSDTIAVNHIDLIERVTNYIYKIHGIDFNSFNPMASMNSPLKNLTTRKT
jgi:hypothetical protein